ncbi:unnamed protein product [Protopolystoma xenopodis]|uniref:Uncharacterized protein n=1 Tax=Protopolystoma xenopodis TaxID=117903 RepID=A0A448X3J9_9PLAT|nr:unnamed protein product [Protopolystoma xenopodis]
MVGETLTSLSGEYFAILLSGFLKPLALPCRSRGSEAASFSAASYSLSSNEWSGELWPSKTIPMDCLVLVLRMIISDAFTNSSLVFNLLRSLLLMGGDDRGLSSRLSIVFIG